MTARLFGILVQHTKILISNLISLIMRSRLDPICIQSQLISQNFEPDIAAHTALNPEAFHEVTTFHPNLPPVRWSSEEKRLASTYGASKDVELVMAKPRFRVTAAMAATGTAGSSMGNCVPVRPHASASPRNTSNHPYVSSRKSALKSPRSSSRARSFQYERSRRFVADLSFAFLSRFTADDDRRIMRTVDLRFLPLMRFMYLVEQVDYTNAASIKVLQVGQPSNVLTELGMTADQYNWIQTVYFVGLGLTRSRPQDSFPPFSEGEKLLMLEFRSAM